MTLKIYIKDSKDIQSIQKKIEKKYTGKSYEIINILTKKGMYKIRGKQMFLYKLISNITKEVEYENINLLITENLWQKKEEMFNIPFEHHLLKKTMIEYTINQKFKIIFEFIHEGQDVKIIDFYFKTDVLNIGEIKKTVISFLSILK